MKEKGNIILVVLLVISGCVLVGGSYFYFSAGNNAQRKEIDPKELVRSYQEKVKAAMADRSAINFSVIKNPNAFACLSTVSADCTGKACLFMLFPTGGTESLSQLGFNSGLTVEGAGCNTYPSRDCPLRVEAQWDPVCKVGACVDTKSFHLDAAIHYDAADGSPAIHWKSDSLLVTPDIKLSAEVQCARGGGTYNGSSCVTANTDRAIASSDTPDQQAPMVNIPAPEVDTTLVCPDTIPVQGNIFPAQITSPGKAEVSIAAINHCPDAVDTYMFMCRPSSTPTFEHEGLWVQVGATLAPPCDESGHPLQEPTRIEDNQPRERQ